MKLLNTSLKKVLALTAILLVGLVVNYIAIAWTGPTATAPGGNTDAPINAGSGSQTKAGDLTVDGNLVVNSAASFDGLASYSNTNLFIGSNGQQLALKPGFKGVTQTLGYITLAGSGVSDTIYTDYDFEAGNNIKTLNQVHASGYCDENGDHCSSSPVSEFNPNITIETVGDHIGVSWPSAWPSKPARVSETANNQMYCALMDYRIRQQGSVNFNGAGCEIAKSGNSWTVLANPRQDAAVYCQMVCFN